MTMILTTMFTKSFFKIKTDDTLTITTTFYGLFFSLFLSFWIFICNSFSFL